MSLDSALSWAGQGSASSLDGSLDAGQQPASCQDVLSSHVVQQAAAYGVGGSVEGCESGVGQTPPPLVWHPPAPPVSHRCRLALAPRGRRSRSKGRVAALPTEAAHLNEHEQNLGAVQKQQQKCQDQQQEQQQQQQQQDDHHRKKHQQPPQQQQQPKGHHQQQVGRRCVAQRALPTRHAAPCRVRGTSPDSVLNTHSALASPACQHHTAGAASASSLPLAMPGAPPSSQLLDLSLLQPLSPVLSTPPQSDVLATFIAATSSICPITPAASTHTSWLDCGEERRMRHRLARAGIATYLQPAVPQEDTAAAERDSPVRARSTLFRREALLSAAGGAGAEGGPCAVFARRAGTYIREMNINRDDYLVFNGAQTTDAAIAAVADKELQVLLHKVASEDILGETIGDFFSGDIPLQFRPPEALAVRYDANDSLQSPTLRKCLFSRATDLLANAAARVELSHGIVRLRHVLYSVLCPYYACIPWCAVNQEKPQISHSTVEKQRRDRINSLIDELRELVPPQKGSQTAPSTAGLNAKDAAAAAEARRPKHVVLADTIALLKQLHLHR
ncbi:hypothetical protein QJQ45_022886, partial [Haematococcus lacustris]